MYHSSDELYKGEQYAANNPGWHEEGSGMKAALVLAFIRKFRIAAGNVVEVGCGAGEILLQLQKQLPGSHFTGYDISPVAIQLASKKANDRLRFFLQDVASLPPQKTDLLLVLDVVEHVDDVYSFLRMIRDKADNFIFHIPLDMSCRTLLKPHTLRQQRTSVGHIHYFSEETALWMLEDVGYEIMEYDYTKPDVDRVRPASFKQWLKKQLRRISFALSKKVSVKLWGNYSLLVWAKPILKEP